ncbi:MAG: TetR/AcrR family transcriptional regulator [Desulfosalsimonadaceae bacterium]
MNKDGKKLTRREKDRLRHRGMMLSAALELFSEKGYPNVSMHEIAHHAEFAIGTLYKFFKNKEDLYSSLLIDIAEQFQSSLVQALKEKGDCHHKLKKYIRTYGEVFMANAMAVRLYFGETFGGGLNLKAALTIELQAYYDDILKKLSDVFAEGIEKSVYRPIDPYHLALSFMSNINAFLFYWLDDPKKHPFEENISIIETVFFEGVLLPKGDDRD